MNNLYKLKFEDYQDISGQLHPGEVEWGEDDLIDFLQQYPGKIDKLPDNTIRLMSDPIHAWKGPYLHFDNNCNLYCIFKSINGEYLYNRDFTIEQLIKKYLDEKYIIETKD